MEPTSNDVLSGRGAWCNQHPGNKLFRKMLDERKVRKLWAPSFHLVSTHSFNIESYKTIADYISKSDLAVC